MRAIYDVPAPAKLNLFLHVTGQRADGLHLLESAFVLIDWCDRLHFERRADGRISREDLGEPLPAEDLVVRAARALKEASGCAAGAHMAIEKNIPTQAGLGGGSSDAASCLLALDRLWSLGLGLPELERIGLTLGADVPFFLRGRNAFVQGIGERITPVALPRARFAVLKPDAGLSTAAVFSSAGLKRDSRAATIASFAANPFGFGHNDLQPVAEQLCAAVPRALSLLGSAGLKARMTGSGSAVFAHLPHAGLGGKAPFIDELPGNWRYRECGSLDVHPLSGWADGNRVEGSW